jgi:type VI protein secretion system component VasK
MKTFFLADIYTDNPLPGFGPMGSAVKERVIVFGTILLVLLLLLGWALLFRRHRRRAARREDRRRRRHSFAKNAVRGVAELNEYVKDRQQGRRRRHRPRNPTLAETGGLPPLRGDDHQPPQSQPH